MEKAQKISRRILMLLAAAAVPGLWLGRAGSFGGARRCASERLGPGAVGRRRSHGGGVCGALGL